jgi:polyhydroxyalkanoate synthase
MAATADPDDLTEIKGIGPKYAALLAELGIGSFAALAAADPESLSSSVDPRARVEDWIAQAKDRTTG